MLISGYHNINYGNVLLGQKLLLTCYDGSKAIDLNKRFCGEWLVMCGGVGLPRWKVWNMWRVLEGREE